jgi:phosphoesterase RecJ-like protein
MMNRIIRHLKNSHHVLLATHTNPDGDAIGSLIAMGLSLEALKKPITLYNESPLPAVYRFLPSVDRVVQCVKTVDCYDTAVILDCSELERVGQAVSRVRQIPTIINIDHHITNTFFGNYQLIETTASSTAEILYRLIKKMAVPLNRDIATLIYTGILTDTGSFRFSNTNQAAFKICQEMIGLGVNPYDVAKQVYGTYSLGRIKLLNLALDSIEISKNGKLSMMTLTRKMFEETGTQSEDLDGMINYARRIEDVKVAVLIHQDPNGTEKSGRPNLFHVSLRSDGTVDVAKIASAYGGGGHSSAAGFSIESLLSDLRLKMFDLSEKL